jgi:hypothetical protein
LEKKERGRQNTKETRHKDVVLSITKKGALGEEERREERGLERDEV